MRLRVALLAKDSHRILAGFVRIVLSARRGVIAVPRRSALRSRRWRRPTAPQGGGWQLNGQSIPPADPRLSRGTPESGRGTLQPPRHARTDRRSTVPRVLIYMEYRGVAFPRSCCTQPDR